MPKRVLLTVHKFFPAHRAGTEVLTLKVAQELLRRGYEVLVLTANPPDENASARNAAGPDTSSYVHEGVNVRVIEEPLRTRGYTFSHEYLHPEIKKYFTELLDEFKPDFVHIFHAQNLSADIIDCAGERGLPVVFSSTDFWFVCPIVQLKLPDGSVCRGPSPGAKNCLGCYTPRLFPPQAEFEQALGERFGAVAAATAVLPGPAKNAVVGALYDLYKSKKWQQAACATTARPAILRDLANKLDAIMVPTRLMRDIFVENGINEELITHVPFGIDTAPLEAFQTKTVSQTLRIGFIGTLFEHKGVDLLIEAFQSLPADADAVLKIYGDPHQFPEYGGHLQALARRPKPNADKIEFCGAFPNSQLGSVLQNIDVLVVPSRWYENTPLVVQSALATKTPLVVTNLGGLSELVSHERNGLLFELNDANSLTEQLCRLLADRELLKRMSASIARERTMVEMVDDIETVYNRVVRSRDYELSKLNG